MPLTWDDADFADRVADRQALWTEQGPDAPIPDAAADPLAALVAEQHARNHRLWHEEDRARDPRADDAVIADVKRRIDRLNQSRNDLVERLDDTLAVRLAERPSAGPPPERWASETPGAMIDRLSILALKVHYMTREAGREDAADDHRARARERAARLAEQRADLTTSLGWAVADLLEGRRQWRMYRQFKMYNDPTMNRYLREAAADHDDA